MHDTPLDTLYPLVISMDAMIFSGGCDIDPVHYGCAHEPGCGRIDPRRDQTELALFDLVLARNIPVLGICRGVQLLNVALGGTLKQDISCLLYTSIDSLPARPRLCAFTATATRRVRGDIQLSLIHISGRKARGPRCHPEESRAEHLHFPRSSAVGEG